MLKKFCSVDIIDNFGYVNQREKSYIETSDMNIFIFGGSLLWVFCDNKVINCFEHTFDTEITKYLVTSKATIGKLLRKIIVIICLKFLLIEMISTRCYQMIFIMVVN